MRDVLSCKSDLPRPRETVRSFGGESSNTWRLAREDLLDSLRLWPVGSALGWNDVKQRYRRATFGVLWITFTQALFLCAIGPMYGVLFKLSLRDYFPFLAAGYITWQLMAGIVTEGCTVFVTSDGFIRQIPMSKSLFVLRMICRNFIIFGHNILVYIPVAVIFSVPVTLNTLWVIVGLLLIFLNGFWFSLVAGMVCARFRDLPPFVASMMQVAFLATPVLWKKDAIAGGAMHMFVVLNPLYHFLEMVRAPLLGRAPDVQTIAAVVLMTVAGFCVSLVFFTRYRSRLPYWI